MLHQQFINNRVTASVKGELHQFDTSVCSQAFRSTSGIQVGGQVALWVMYRHQVLTRRKNVSSKTGDISDDAATLQI